MLALAIVLIVIGIVGLFFFTYAGAVVGAVGVLLLIAFLVGFGRATATEHTPRPRP